MMRALIQQSFIGNNKLQCYCRLFFSFVRDVYIYIYIFNTFRPPLPLMSDLNRFLLDKINKNWYLGNIIMNGGTKLNLTLKT